MYPTEYMCTKQETTNTGISMDTVKESKLNPQYTLRDSESTQVKSCTNTGVLFKPISRKVIIDKIVVIVTHNIVIACAPLVPIFLPKNPDTIEPSKGKTIMARYII